MLSAQPLKVSELSAGEPSENSVMIGSFSVEEGMKVPKRSKQEI